MQLKVEGELRCVFRW